MRCSSIGLMEITIPDSGCRGKPATHPNANRYLVSTWYPNHPAVAIRCQNPSVCKRNSGTLLTESTNFNRLCPSFYIFQILIKICVKAVQHGPAKRVGGTQSRAQSLCPFKVPFKLPALAAPILYSESFSEGM
jgi:hypothetical protein